MKGKFYAYTHQQPNNGSSSNSHDESDHKQWPTLHGAVEESVDKISRLCPLRACHDKDVLEGGKLSVKMTQYRFADATGMLCRDYDVGLCDCIVIGDELVSVFLDVIFSREVF